MTDPATLSRVPLTTGFTTGSGKTVTIASLASLARSKRLIKECLKESNAVALTQRDDGSTLDEFVPSVDGNRTRGSLSVSAKPIKSISVEAMKQTAVPFNEFDNEPESKEGAPTIESSPLKVNASPTIKDVTSAMSPVLDFDGSFEISSQMMNVLEGKTSQPQPNEGSLLIEEQRAALRVEQERKAESRFKPLVTASLIPSRKGSGSISSRTLYSKAHKVIQEPVMPGLLWQYHRGCVRPVGQNIRTYSTPVSKDMRFMNDFLRLDNASTLSATTASDLKFKMDSDGMSISYLLGDHVEIIPDCSGYAGCVEVVR